MLLESTRRLRETGEHRPTACVVGGGIAGVAAAVHLAEAGWRVTLLESRNYLGGRATSHVDPRTALPLDNCQHVLLRCCTAMNDLLGKLGVAGDVEWHDRLFFLDERGRSSTVRSARLPAPTHLAPSLLACGFLSARAKLAVTRGMLSLLRRPHEASASETFGEWLGRNGQPRDAVDRFWSVVVVSALNEAVERASAQAAAKVFREAFLGAADAYHVGVPRVPLVRLYERVGGILRRNGGEVRLGTGVKAFDVQGDRVEGVSCAHGTSTRADAYVCALPPDRLQMVLSPATRRGDSRFDGIPGLTFVPIVGVHLWFARRVFHLPHAALVGSPLHWLFDRGVDPDGTQHLHGVASAAREWADLPRDEIARRVAVELRRYVPASAGARLVRVELFKERRATFSPAPGVDALRPAASGTIANLFLAGDYCRTGWPATMEGAARSGRIAAEAAVAARQGVAP